MKRRSTIKKHELIEVGDMDTQVDYAMKGQGGESYCSIINKINWGGVDKEQLGKVSISELFFLDPELERCVKEHVEEYSWKLVSEFTRLECSNEGIKYLEGLWQLPFLKVLVVSDNPLSKLRFEIPSSDDVKGIDDWTNIGMNLKSFLDLKYLDVGFTGISCLHLEKNGNLEELIVRQNNLSELDVRRCPKLNELDLEMNPLRELKLPNGLLANTYRLNRDENLNIYIGGKLIKKGGIMEVFKKRQAYYMPAFFDAGNNCGHIKILSTILVIINYIQNNE